MIKELRDEFIRRFHEEPSHYLDCGGRFEVLGNHTDHNHGMCIAGTCALAISCGVNKRKDNKVYLISKGYEPFIIDISNTKIDPSEENTSQAIIRGVANYLSTNGYSYGGMNIYMVSNIPDGAGVSSSAAFELLIGQLFNVLFNDGKIEKLTLCLAGQYAEREYYGKKCGLLDQIGVAYGGYTYMDFKDDKNPVIESLRLDITGYHFVLINTGGSHADLSPLYTAIPNEMFQVARLMGYQHLRKGNKEELLKNKDSLISRLGNRPFNRALHFYDENERVGFAKRTIQNKDIPTLISLINASRVSSTELLQNMFVNSVEKSPLEACNLVMAASDNRAAVKINGGGFAGSVVALVPDYYLNRVISNAKNEYGEHNVHVIEVRNSGPDFIKE